MAGPASDLEFREPPAAMRNHPGRPGEWPPVLEQLRERPGEWAVLRSTESGATEASVRSTQQYLTARYGDLGYEFVSRKEGAVVYLYGRAKEA